MLVWTLLPVLVNPNSLGTAYGFGYGIQNIGLLIAPFLVDKVIKDDETYTNAIIMLLI